MSDSYHFGQGQTKPQGTYNQAEPVPFNREGAHEPPQNVGGGASAQPYFPEMAVDQASASAITRNIMRHVFAYMFSGLLLSGFIAVAIMQIANLQYLLLNNPMILLVAAIGQLVVVFAFTFAARKLKAKTALALFYVYSALTGVTLSLFLSAFTLQSVVLSFLIAAATFGGMAIWGYKTQKDLSAIGSAGRMLLLGVIIASLVNVVLYFVAPGFASILDMLLNYVVVAIFVGLTAYDMQKIKQMAYNMGAYQIGPETATLHKTVAINGALNLYLDFINIFIRLLMIMGRRK